MQTAERHSTGFEPMPPTVPRSHKQSDFTRMAGHGPTAHVMHECTTTRARLDRSRGGLGLSTAFAVARFG